MAAAVELQQFSDPCRICGYSAGLQIPDRAGDFARRRVIAGKDPNRKTSRIFMVAGVSSKIAVLKPTERVPVSATMARTAGRTRLQVH